MRGPDDPRFGPPGSFGGRNGVMPVTPRYPVTGPGRGPRYPHQQDIYGTDAGYGVYRDAQGRLNYKQTPRRQAWGPGAMPGLSPMGPNAPGPVGPDVGLGRSPGGMADIGAIIAQGQQLPYVPGMNPPRDNALDPALGVPFAQQAFDPSMLANVPQRGVPANAMMQLLQALAARQSGPPRLW